MRTGRGLDSFGGRECERREREDCASPRAVLKLLDRAVEMLVRLVKNTTEVSE